MSRSARVDLKWADGNGSQNEGAYRFRLPIKQMEELQEICNAGPQELLTRLRTGTWKLRDIREPIRLGLIGGGDATPAQALKLVERYVDERPLIENAAVAQAIVLAAVIGFEDDPPGESEAATPEKTAKSLSPESTESPPASPSPDGTLTT